MSVFTAAILGVVEGLTEFIPISSTGHLILAAELLRIGGEQTARFLIFIQLGAILAVVVFFRQRFVQLLRSGSGFASRRGLGLLALTTLPAVVAGLLGHNLIRAELFKTGAVAAGLAAGGLWIIVGERWARASSPRGLDEVTWRDALGIGLFQCLALWPGMSRAAATIMGGLLLGLNRKAATEYSFLAAVPVMIGACLFALFEGAPVAGPADGMALAVGFGVSFLTAWIAIKGFIQFVSHNTLALFGWYRLVLAALILMVLR